MESESIEAQPAEPTPAPAPTPLPVRREGFDAKEFAAGFPRANECESAARSLQARAPDQAWAALRACVDHNNFTLLRTLVSGAWDRDLQTRPDASILVAKVIATRGGDVEGDLTTLRKRKVPVFSLAAALASPHHYKGQLVIIRARVAQLPSATQGKAAVFVEEMSLGSDVREVELGPGTVRRYSETGYSKGSFNSSRGREPFEMSGSRSGVVREYETERRAENSSAETGRSAIVRLQKSDPFLEPGREFIFLARFDSVRSVSTTEDETPSAVLSLIGYYEPSALVID